MSPERDPIRAARAAALHYVRSGDPGFRRRRAGKHFSYVRADGRPVRDRAELSRIRTLAIPPAWTDVWICATARGHLQATGRDARGRKQYRYHPRWRAVRDETKYARLTAFARALPHVRACIHADLARPGMPREKVLAALVRLLESTCIRVGNEEYARANGSFGLTTMLDRHVLTAGHRLRLRFRGKGGKTHDVPIDDRRLAVLIKHCRDIPGQHLFQYVDGAGRPHAVTSGDVNTYVHALAGDAFTAKDFRTWGGTLRAASSMAEMRDVARTGGRTALAAVVEAVAAALGNTPAICRKCYIHPHVLAILGDTDARRRWERANARPIRVRGLDARERVLLRYLELCPSARPRLRAAA